MTRTWTLENYADTAAHSTRLTMTDLVESESHEPGTPIQWNPVMTLVRGGAIIGFAETDESEAFAQILGMCISGFAPDVITAVVDTYTTNVEINPHTGQPWQHGELGEYLVLNPGCNVLLRPPETQGDEVFVSDALNVVTANRAGDLCIHTMPYRITGREIRWARQLTTTEPPRDSLADMIRFFMLAPTIEHEIANNSSEPGMFARAMLSPDPDVRRANLDLTLAGYLSTHYRVEVRMDVTPGSKRGDVFRGQPGWRVVGDHVEFDNGNEGENTS